MREDWIEIELGEVCQIKMGQSPPSSTYNKDKIGLPFFQGKAEFTELHPIVEKWCSKPTKTAELNDILLSVRAPVGSTNVANQKCAIGRGLAAISYQYDFKYILFLLKLIEKNLDNQGTGTTFRAISGTVLKSQIVPLAPLPIQRAIVTKIENLFASLDKGIADLELAQKQLKVYRQAVLKKAFEGGLTNKNIKGGELPLGWKRLSLFDIVNKNTQKALPSEMPNAKFIGMDCIEANTLKPFKFYDFREFKSAGNVFKVNQVLYGRMRPYLNKVYKAEIDGTCSGEFIVLDCKDDFNPDLLKYILHHRDFVSFANHKTSGDRPRISFEEIADYPVNVCNPDEQAKIVREIESRLSVCDKVEQSIAESLEKSKALRQSILKKAFEGKLLSKAEIDKCKQEKDYEPAQKLLQRIKGIEIKEPQKKAEPLAQKKKTDSNLKISADIQAGVIAKVIKLHEDKPEYLKNLSHVKCEKISHLVEYYLQIPLGRIPVKDAAGPDDYPHLKKVEHRAKMVGYFNVVKQDIGHTYTSGRNLTNAIEKLEEKLSQEKRDKLDRLINLFLKFDLESAEVVATIYAGWNNLLIDGKIPTDDEIVYESRENWSKRKLSIERERFFKALSWMRQDDVALIPSGNGMRVDKPTKNIK